MDGAGAGGAARERRKQLTAAEAVNHKRQLAQMCVEPRPLVQTGPQGDSLLACGTRQRRRPSRLERARRREAHWTVVASPLAALSPPARSSAEIPVC